MPVLDGTLRNPPRRQGLVHGGKGGGLDGRQEARVASKTAHCVTKKSMDLCNPGDAVAGKKRSISGTTAEREAPSRGTKEGTFALPITRGFKKKKKKKKHTAFIGAGRIAYVDGITRVKMRLKEKKKKYFLERRSGLADSTLTLWRVAVPLHRREEPKK